MTAKLCPTSSKTSNSLAAIGCRKMAASSIRYRLAIAFMFQRCRCLKTPICRHIRHSKLTPRTRSSRALKTTRSITTKWAQSSLKTCLLRSFPSGQQTLCTLRAYTCRLEARCLDFSSGWLTEEENLILVSTSESCGKSNRLYYHDLRSTDFTIKGKLDLKPLFVKDDFRYDFICEMGDNEALILTNKDAPMEKLIRK